MTDVRIRVLGAPIPQGSKTAGIGKNGRAYVRDANPKPLEAWRDEVTKATRNTIGATRGFTQLTGPLEISIRFLHERPGYHYRTGRFSHLLKDNAPVWVAVKPDVDKILRSVCDGLTDGGVYKDDAQIARIGTIEQVYANVGEFPGADIWLRPAPPTRTIHFNITQDLARIAQHGPIHHTPGALF